MLVTQRIRDNIIIGSGVGAGAASSHAVAAIKRASDTYNGITKGPSAAAKQRSNKHESLSKSSLMKL